MKYITILLTVFLLKSCGNTKDITIMQDNKEEQSIENIKGEYLVTKIGANDSLSHLPTLEFDESTNRVSGFAGCNRFFGNYKIEGNSITFSQLGSTKMMCDEEANMIENKFLNILNEANQIAIEDGNVILLKNENPLLVANKKQEQNITITYQASSRGSFEEVSVSKDSFSLCNDVYRKHIKSFKYDVNEWNACLELLKKIDVANLPKIKAPTSMRQYDGAPHASLIITNGTEVIQSNSFDHGHPPEEIKALVEKLLSFKNMTAKQ